MSTTFYYSVIRVVPHPIREESFNLGVLLISESGHYADFRFTKAFQAKLRALAPDVHVGAIRRFVEDFQVRFPKIGKMESLSEGDRLPASLETLTEFANYHSTQIKFTMPRPVMVDNPDDTLKGLFEEFVAPIRLSRQRIIDRPTIRGWLFSVLRDCRVSKAAIVDAPKIPVRHGYNTLDLGIRRKTSANGIVAMALEPISFELPTMSEIVRLRDHVAWVAHDSHAAASGVIIGAVVTEPTQASRALYEESIAIFKDERVEVVQFEVIEPFHQLLLRADVGALGSATGGH